MGKKSKHSTKGKGSPLDRDDRKKRWQFGQNFLVDDGVIRQIAEDVPLTSSDWVIEIGPGQGALTRRLANRCAKLTALEIDPKWVEHIQKHPEWGNVEVIRSDATRADVEELLLRHAPTPDARPVVVGNLPYNRAAPILFRFLPFMQRFRSMHIMVQYEVGKRIAAKPHTRDFGFLTVFVQNLAKAALVRKIGPDAFRPRPKVLSATIELTPLEAPMTLDPMFLSFVELAFTQKRKKLANVLAPFYPRDRIMATLQAVASGEAARAEDLSVEEFVTAFNALGPPPGAPARRKQAPMESLSDIEDGEGGDEGEDGDSEVDSEEEDSED